MGEYLAFIPLVIALIGMGVIIYFTVSSRGRNSVMKNMMKNNMEVLKDMTSGEMGETLKDLSKELGYTDKKKYAKNPELYRGVITQFYKGLRLLLTHQEHGIAMDDIVDEFYSWLKNKYEPKK